MDMKRLIAALTGISIMFFAGCAGDKATKDALQNAEVLMDERPDSALEILSSINDQSIFGKSDKNHYQLLKAQARDKCYIDDVDDSLMLSVVEYYKRHSDKEKLFKAYYYLGRIQQNSGKYSNAIYSYAEAEQLIEYVINPYYKGILYAHLGRLFDLYYDYVNAVEAHKKAKEYYEEGGYLRHSYYSLMDVGHTELKLKNYDTAEQIINEVLNWAYENDAYLCNYAFTVLCRLYETIGNDSQLEWLLKSKYSFVDSGSLIKDLSYVYQYVKSGEYEKADELLNNAWSKANTTADSASIYFKEYQLNKYSGNYRIALDKHEIIFQMQDSILRSVLQQSLLRTQRDYLNAKTELLKKENKIVRQKAYIISFILIGGLVILILSLLLMSGKIKQIKEERRLSEEKYLKIYDEALDEIERLKETLEDNKLTSAVQQRISERLNLLNTFIVSNMTPNYSKSALEQLKQLMDDKDYFIESTRLSFLVEHPKFISYLQQYGFTDNEIGYCCLYAMGLKGKDISSYLGKGHYKQSSAIRKKLGLNEHDTNLDIYIRDLISKESSL